MTALAKGNMMGTPSYCLQQLPLRLACAPAEQQSRHCSSEPLNVLSKRLVPFKNDTDGGKKRAQGVGRARVGPHSWA